MKFAAITDIHGTCMSLAAVLADLASLGFLTGNMTMPLCCLLAAWRKSFRHLFPIPVVAVFSAILLVLIGGI